MHLKRGRNARCDGAVTPSRPDGRGFSLQLPRPPPRSCNVRLTSTPAVRYAPIAVIADDMANGSIDASADEFESAAHHVYLAPNAPRTPLCFSFSAAPTANS